MSDDVRWTADVTAGEPLSLAQLESGLEAMRNAPTPGPAVRLLSPTRYAKCARGEHELARGVCVHCWTAPPTDDMTP